MGRKTNPIAFRTLVSRKWKSRWFADGQQYAEFLIEDHKLRNTVFEMFAQRGGISDVEIERDGNEVKIFIRTSRPGVIIGRGGTGAADLKNKLQKLSTNKIKDITIEEVRDPDLNARILGEGIVAQLERRIAFRRAMRQALDKAVKAGAKGIKISVSGRLNGAEIARREVLRDGTIPLQTISADVDYAYLRAKTTYGILGVKVWIYLGKEVSSDIEIKKPVESIVKGK